MRLVFVNQLHPDTGLIGSVRLSRFADELASRGHQVLMLCESLQAGDSADSLAGRITAHDWSVPLIFGIGAESSPRPDVARRRTPALLKRLATAWTLLVRGGSLWRWRRALRDFYPLIKMQFQPELCFATFGCLDALAAARELGTVCNVPWVMDIKDPASSFLPDAFRPLLTRRFRDAAAVTLNSDYQRGQNDGWVTHDALTIYSGVETSQPVVAHFDPASFALVGSIYDESGLATLLGGFRSANASSGQGWRLRYFGTDGELVARVARELGGVDGLEIRGMVKRTTLLQICAESAASLYVGAHRTFHHKFLELAALGRPLIVCPAESDEARELARKFGSDLFEADVVPKLIPHFLSAINTPTKEALELRGELGWPTVSAKLERCFASVLALSQGNTK